MAFLIADTASVDPRAELADGVEVGPYCVVGPEVRIGRGTRLVGHVYLLSRTTLGASNVVSPFVVIGGDPQDRLERAPTRVEIGDRNLIREGVTINRAGGPSGEGVTRLGSDNLIMAGAHVAHDVWIGDQVTVGNDSRLGGRVRIEDHATLTGGAAVHHDVTVGTLALVKGQSKLYHDAPPYMLLDGGPPRVRCLNIVGLKRRGLAPEAIHALHEAHRLVFRARMDPDRAAEVLASHGQATAEVEHLLAFLRSQKAGRHGRSRTESGGGAAATSIGGGGGA